MTVSGTTAFNLDFVEAIEEAFERAGIESRTGYDQRSARRSINLLFLDWANRGLNMWTYEERTQLLTYGVGEYTLGADIVDVIEQVVQIPSGSPASYGPTRYNLTRVSITTQATRTNPNIVGRPTEVYYDRAREAPVAHIWPLPGDQGPYTLVYHVLRRLDEAGDYTNTADVPFRFLPAFIAGLAYMIAAKKRQDAPELIAYLKAEYEEVWQRAADEDREKAALTLTPLGSTYRVN